MSLFFFPLSLSDLAGGRAADMCTSLLYRLEPRRGEEGTEH